MDRQKQYYQTQIDLSEKHIATLQQNLTASKKRGKLEEDRRSSLPVFSNESSTDIESSPSTSVHAMVKSQQAMVTKKNQEIAELQKELNLLREIIPKREGDGGEAPTLLQLEIPANSEEILNLRADVKALKRK